MRKIFLLVITMLFGCCLLSANENGESPGPGIETSTPTQRLYGLKAPVKVMHEWCISVSELTENPGLNTSDRSAVIDAISSGILDEMSTQIIEYQFTSDGKVAEWVTLYDDQTPKRISIAGMPGSVFDVAFANGLPTDFILDKRDLQNTIDEELIFLDAYDKGLEYFTIHYSNELPIKLSGKSMEFFGGDIYEETYSEYRFDEKGNWISRTVTTPYDTIKQFRSYEY